MTKIGAIVGSVIGLFASLAIVVFMILSIAGVFPFTSNTINHYQVRFIANDKILFSQIYQRGEKIEANVTVPSKPNDKYGHDYVFLGWDTNGDSIVNPVPTRAYSTFDAVAIYRATSIPTDYEVNG